MYKEGDHKRASESADGIQQGLEVVVAIQEARAISCLNVPQRRVSLFHCSQAPQLGSLRYVPALRTRIDDQTDPFRPQWDWQTASGFQGRT